MMRSAPHSFASSTTAWPGSPSRTAVSTVSPCSRSQSPTRSVNSVERSLISWRARSGSPPASYQSSCAGGTKLPTTCCTLTVVPSSQRRLPTSLTASSEPGSSSIAKSTFTASCSFLPVRDDDLLRLSRQRRDKPAEQQGRGGGPQELRDDEAGHVCGPDPGEGVRGRARKCHSRVGERGRRGEPV